MSNKLEIYSIYAFSLSTSAFSVKSSHSQVVNLTKITKMQCLQSVLNYTIQLLKPKNFNTSPMFQNLYFIYLLFHTKGDIIPEEDIISSGEASPIFGHANANFSVF